MIWNIPLIWIIPEITWNREKLTLIDQKYHEIEDYYLFDQNWPNRPVITWERSEIFQFWYILGKFWSFSSYCGLRSSYYGWFEVNSGVISGRIQFNSDRFKINSGRFQVNSGLKLTINDLKLARNYMKTTRNYLRSTRIDLKSYWFRVIFYRYSVLTGQFHSVLSILGQLWSTSANFWSIPVQFWSIIM